MTENPAPNQGTPSSTLNYSPAGYTGAPPTKDETNLATLTYVLAIFTGFIGPLIIWLMKKDQSQFVDDQGKEVLNWCITMVAAWIVCFILVFVLIGLFLMPLVGLLHLIFTIMGAVRVSGGVAYRYPFAIRLLK